MPGDFLLRYSPRRNSLLLALKLNEFGAEVGSPHSASVIDLLSLPSEMKPLLFARFWIFVILSIRLLALGAVSLAGRGVFGMFFFAQGGCPLDEHSTVLCTCEPIVPVVCPTHGTGVGISPIAPRAAQSAQTGSYEWPNATILRDERGENLWC